MGSVAVYENQHIPNFDRNSACVSRVICISVDYRALTTMSLRIKSFSSLKKKSNHR